MTGGAQPGVFTMLLSHDPALFPAAAKEGIGLVLSGHTHGGQVALPFFPKLLSLGRLAHRFHLGLYRDGGEQGPDLGERVDAPRPVEIIVIGHPDGVEPELLDANAILQQ